MNKKELKEKMDKKEVKERMNDIILKHQASITKDFDLADAILIQMKLNDVKDNFARLFDEYEETLIIDPETLPKNLRNKTEAFAIKSNRFPTKTFTFKSLISLLQMISKEDHNKAKEYCRKLVNELCNEKYYDDAEILIEFIDSW